MMKVKLRNCDDLPTSPRLSDHDYIIDMYGVVYNVKAGKEYYVILDKGKYYGRQLYKKHCIVLK